MVNNSTYGERATSLANTTSVLHFFVSIYQTILILIISLVSYCSVSNIGWTMIADVVCRPSWDKPLEVSLAQHSILYDTILFNIATDFAMI